MTRSGMLSLLSVLLVGGVIPATTSSDQLSAEDKIRIIVNDDGEVVDPVLKLARQLKMPVMFHPSFGQGTEPHRVTKVAARFSDVNIIMDHPGIDEFYKAATEAARNHANLYLYMAHAEPKALRAFLDRVPSGQIIYGCDAPWGKWAMTFDLVREASQAKPDI